MGMPKYKEQLAFTVTISKDGMPDHEFNIYINGAIDGFPEGEKISISNKIPVFIHESYVRGENIGRCSALMDVLIAEADPSYDYKGKSLLPEKKPIGEWFGFSHVSGS